MTDSKYVRFLQWALPQLGMRWVGFRKVRGQLRKRINRRLRELQLADVDAYRTYLARHSHEWNVLDSLCRVTISRFYRGRRAFDALGSDVLPQLATLVVERGDSALCCWCIGCASGEEVYTLAIIWDLAVAPQFPGLEFDAIATDVDPTLLERARHGCYSSSSLKCFPGEWLDVAFSRLGSEFYVRDAFRRRIEFRQQDVRRETPAGRFHLILCRNLAFTYFDADGQRQLLQSVVEHLAAGGVLMIGEKEQLPQHTGCLVECREAPPGCGLFRKTPADREDFLPASVARLCQPADSH